MGVRLHIGCGLIHRPGWINLDRYAAEAADLLADAVLLPFADGCIEAVETLQLVEHLGYVGNPVRLARVGTRAVPRWCAAR